MRRGGGNTRDTLWPLAGSMASGHWEVCAEGRPGYGVDFLKGKWLLSPPVHSVTFYLLFKSM